MASRTFTRQERDDLVRAYAATLKEYEELEFGLSDPANVSDPELSSAAALSSRLSALAERYRDGLPSLAISRCPFTSQVVSHSFDPYGFDGMWWQYHAPLRPASEPGAGPCFVGLTGAVRIQQPPEYTEFLVVPGPGAPFVIPRVLNLPQVRAVVSLLTIGKHLGAAIAYFASADLGDVRPPTVWGTEWTTLDPVRRNPLRADAPSDMERDFDFELEPWVRAGKLLWIAPGDTGLSLRQGVEACPYLKLSGEREIQRIHHGEYWTS